MLVVAVSALPFHCWVLAPVVHALRERGVEVTEATHTPRHDRDWLCNQPPGGLVPSLLARTRPDAVLCCEYPYPVLRRWAGGAPVVTLRHSLAGRRNTWEPEQAEADLVVSWSEWDERHLRRRARCSPHRLLRAGCTLTEPLADGEPSRMPLGVLWAPSHNAELSARAWVLPALGRLVEADVPVAARLHAATAMREPAFHHRVADLGIRLLPPDEPPYAALRAAQVLVADVSGVAILGAHLPDLPLVQVEPHPADVARSNQHDPQGPEWVFRDALGALARTGADLERRVRERLDPGFRDPLREARAGVCRVLTGGLPACAGAAGRVADGILERFGGAR